jgi:hemoglobin/transferrin/lactoferrin receptor protein
MKIHFLFLTIISISFLELNAQILKVIDPTTLQPVTDAIITSGLQITFTDINGEADISGYTGMDTIIIESLGYQRMVVSYLHLKANNFKISLRPTVYPISEVVISANRFEEKKEDIPLQIVTIPLKEITFANRQTTADLLESTGSVMIQKSQAGGGSPIIRGFEANKVLIVIDGVRMNNAIFRGGHLQNVISIDPASLERTEIIFGPASVVYGSDALGGVMHFFTRTPRFSENDSVKFNIGAYTRYASANEEKTGHVDVNIGGSHLASFTSFTYSSFDDLRTGKNFDEIYGDWGKRNFYQDFVNGVDTMIKNSSPELQKYSGYNQADIIQKFRYSKNKFYIHHLNLQFSITSDVPRYDRLTETRDNGNFSHAEWYYGPQKRFMAAYSFQLIRSSRFIDNANLTVSFQDITESRHNRGFGSSILNNRKENVWAYTLNMDFEKRIKIHEIRFGLEAIYNDVTSTAFGENIYSGETTAIDTRYPDGGSEVFNPALYLTHTIEFSDKFILTEGLRLSYHSLWARFTDTLFYKVPLEEVKQNAAALSSAVGLVHRPGRNWRLTISASTGFRAPNIDDLAKIFESSPGNVIVPNPDLKPEYTYNLETGISKLVGKRFYIQANGWYTLYRNAITVGNFSFNGKDSIIYEGNISAVKANLNAGEAFLYGISGEVKMDITQGFSLQSNLNYTFGRIVTDAEHTPLDHIPPLYGRIAINFSANKIRASVYAVYHGNKKLADYNIQGEDNIQYATKDGMPSWYTLNASTAYYASSRFSVQLALENIMDMHYRIFASGISAPGRNFIITLRGNF